MTCVALALIVLVAGSPVPPPPAAQVAPRPRSVSPQASEAYLQFLLGRRLEGEGDTEGAIAAHRRAAALDPQSAEIRAELAALYARLDRPPEAVEWAEAALALDGDNREAHRVLGLIDAALADRPAEARRLGLGEATAEEFAARAARHLEKADRDALVDPSLHFALGRVYVRQRAYKQAIAVFRRLREEEPGVSEASLLLAEAYAATGNLAEARKTLEEAVAEQPDFLRARLQLAELAEREGRWREAADQYARALAISPGSVELTRRRAVALLRAGDAARARDLLEELVKNGKAGAVDLSLLGGACLELRDYARAVQTLEQARTLAPGDPTVLFQLGAAYESRGRDADAERAFRELLARDPLHAPALNYLGYMLADRGRALDEAVDLITRALARDPRNAAYLDSLGWAYFKLDRLDLAEGPLRQAAAELMTNSVVQDHLGDLLFRLKRVDEAIAAWQRALAGDGESIERATIEAKIREARAKSERR